MGHSDASPVGQDPQDGRPLQKSSPLEDSDSDDDEDGREEDQKRAGVEESEHSLAK